MQQIPKVALQSGELDQLGMGGSQFSAENHISLGQASRRPVHSPKFIDWFDPNVYLTGWGKFYKSTIYLQYKYGYDSQTSSVFEHNCKNTCKHVACLHHSSNIVVFKKENNLHHGSYLFGFILWTSKHMTYCLPDASFLASFCRTSISIIAASLYFCTERITLIATISLLSRSQHSSTWPNVPKQQKHIKYYR